jgi:hypothetical protein
MVQACKSGKGDRMRRLWLFVAALLLAACGGGKPATGNAAAAPPGNDEGKAAEASWVNKTATVEAEGKLTEFPHAVALWDSAGRELRVVFTQKEISKAEWKNWRNMVNPPGLTEPYMVCMFALGDLPSTFSPSAVAAHNFIVANVTKVSPVQFSNIGPESIKVLSGNMNGGATIKLEIAFRAEESDFGGEEKFHIDVHSELVLK